MTVICVRERIVLERFILVLKGIFITRYRMINYTLAVKSVTRLFISTILRIGNTFLHTVSVAG